MKNNISLLKIKKNQILGKNKKELIDIFGLEKNYYDLDEWSYFLGKNMLGGEKYLILEFTIEKVSKIYSKTIYNYI